MTIERLCPTCHKPKRPGSRHKNFCQCDKKEREGRDHDRGRNLLDATRSNGPDHTRSGHSNTDPDNHNI